jgi:hypothetical protein
MSLKFFHFILNPEQRRVFQLVLYIILPEAYSGYKIDTYLRYCQLLRSNQTSESLLRTYESSYDFYYCS